jgi:hypothetical protein
VTSRFAALKLDNPERFQSLRRELGVESFGINLITLERPRRPRLGVMGGARSGTPAAGGPAAGGPTKRLSARWAEARHGRKRDPTAPAVVTILRVKGTILDLAPYWCPEQDRRGRASLSLSREGRYSAAVMH